MRRALAVLAAVVLSAAAHADDAHLQMRQVAGPFVVSLFTTPEVLAVGPADVSVLVEQGATPRVLLDAEVSVTLMRHDGGAPPIHARLRHADAANRLLQAAQISLPSPGVWDAAVVVREGGSMATAPAQLVVAPYSSRRGTVWGFALLPAAVVALFLMTERQRRRARMRRGADTR